METEKSEIEFYTVGLIEEPPVARFNGRFFLVDGSARSRVFGRYFSFFCSHPSVDESCYRRFRSFPVSCKATGKLLRISRNSWNENFDERAASFPSLCEICQRDDSARKIRMDNADRDPMEGIDG